MARRPSAGDGPRDFSAFEATSASGDARWQLGGTRLQLQASWYDSPDAENPGALTEAEMERDPTLPDSNNIIKKAGKVVKQTMFSLQGMRDIGSFSLTASGHSAHLQVADACTGLLVDLVRASAP